MKILLFLAINAFGLEKLQVDIQDFSCGLVLTGESGIIEAGIKGEKINPGCVSDAQNVFFREKFGSVIARKNIGRFNSPSTVIGNANSTIENMFELRNQDGSYTTIIRSSSTLARCSGTAGPGNPACTTFSGVTFNSTTPSSGVIALGRVWFIGGGTTPFYTDSSFNITFVNSMPQGTQIATHRNRLLIIGVPANLSRLYLSGESDGEDWTLGGNSTSPAIISIGGVNDFNSITCLMGSLDDIYIIGKLDSKYGLYGFDQDDFQIRLLNDEIGCSSEGAVSLTDYGSMIFLSRDSVYEYYGSYRKISENVDALVRRIGAIAARSKQGGSTQTRRKFASIYYKNKYFLSYTSSALTGFVNNDNVLVYEGQNTWTKIYGMNAASFINRGDNYLAEDSLYFGNSNGDGNLYQYGCVPNSGCANPESSIDAYIVTNNIDFGDSSKVKTFDSVYIDFFPRPYNTYGTYSSFSMPVSYTVDSLDDTASEVIVNTITESGTDRLHSTKLNLAKSGIASTPKGRFMKLKLRINQQYNPFMLHRLKIKASMLGRYN